MPSAPPSSIALGAPIEPAQKPTQMMPTLLAVWAASTMKEKARPRISSGVVSCTVDWRTATVTASAAPSMAITISPSQSQGAAPMAKRRAA